jgi:6-phosphogluconolactonase
MNLRIFDSADDLVHAAARTVLQKIGEGARTIALSGGSTPKPMYELLGKETIDVPVTWIVVDERYVPIDDPQSNAAMIEKTLHPARFLRFKTELGDPAATARAFEDEWRALGIERLDVVLLGVGDDGHTASLFPGTSALQVEDRIATEVWVEKLKMWRVTLTKPVIRDAALRIVLAAGETKRPVLEQVRAGVEHPIAQVTRGVETWWMVDRAAAPASSS